MLFLRPSDYNRSIQADSLTKIIEADNSILEQAEQTAIEEMQSYLRARYDVVNIFSYTSSYDSGVTYSMGARVSSADTYFFSVTSGNTGNSLSDPLFWTQGDNRNQLLVTNCIDITLYHIYSRVAPRNIPELRHIRYTAAVSWLNSVASGTISANLPEKNAAEKEGYSIRYGSSSTKNSNFY